LAYNESPLKDFGQTLKVRNHFLITTHVQPDGDGVGSEIALFGFLKKLGKDVVIFNPSPTPEKFQIADPNQVIQVFALGTPLPKVEAVIVVDTNETKMLGPLEAPLKALKVPFLFVDHHVKELSNVEGHLIDESMSSSGELVYQFIKSQSGEVDYDMAVALYVAIVTDTGNFRFQRTTPATHEMAAELLRKGVKPESVFEELFSRDSVQKLKLLGEALKSIEISSDGSCAWLTIPKEIRINIGATIEDTESFIGHLLILRGVKIAALFREEDNGTVKLSLRGLRKQPVIEIAKKFGGGGHRFAAGARISKSLQEAKQVVLQEIEKNLKNR